MLILVRTKKLVSKDDPFFSTTTMASEDVSFDLWQLGFNFAIEKIDPTIGRLKVYHRHDHPENGRSETPIDMIDCDELLSQPNAAKVPNNKVIMANETLKGR